MFQYLRKRRLSDPPFAIENGVSPGFGHGVDQLPYLALSSGEECLPAGWAWMA